MYLTSYVVNPYSTPKVSSLDVRYCFRTWPSLKPAWLREENVNQIWNDIIYNSWGTDDNSSHEEIPSATEQPSARIQLKKQTNRPSRRG